jgi:putative ABC transport system permease protein
MMITSDLRDAWRGLRGGKGTTALAFAILVLTMTAGTVTFSVVDAVALRPLPFASPDTLVAIARGGDQTPALAAPQDYFSWEEGVTAFQAIGAARPGGSLRLLDDEHESVTASQVTSSLFEVLGVRPFAGRLFGPQHAQAGNDDVVVLSYGLWTRRFGGHPDAIGRRVTFLDAGNRQTTREVIGVLPRGVTLPIGATAEPDVFVPYVPSAIDRSHAFGGRAYLMWVVGRLAPGVTLDRARADVERVSAVIAETYPNFPARPVVMPLHDRVVGSARPWLFLALSAVGLVLLVASVNVASLLLARATVRVRELAIREALGASRARLARGFLLEGLILSLSASAVAVVASFWGVASAKALLPDGLARTSGIGVDARVLLVSIGVSMLCGLVFASAPAWLASRGTLLAQTKFGSGGVIGGRRSARSLGAFLVAEMAFVSLLLVATTLVVTSFVAITTMDLGFDRRNLMSIPYRISVETASSEDDAAGAAAVRADLLDRVRAIPGVTGAAIATLGGAPLSGGTVRYSLDIPGYGETPRDEMLETRAVTPGYFEVLGQQLLQGRTFDASDRTGAPFVAIINDEARRRFFGDRDPVGQVVTFQTHPTTIVGVLRSMHLDGPEAPVRPELYVPVDQPFFRGTIPSMGGTVVVRTAGPAAALAPIVGGAIRPALAGADPQAAMFVDERFTHLTRGRRFNAALMSMFGLVAIAIGALGIYGTMAFFVAQQVRAIGLRMAVGASPARVMRAVLRDAVWRVAAGVAIGLAGAWAVSSALAAFVFGVTPTHPGVYVTVAGVVTAVGLAAALVPAIRAARLDPLIALRTE